VNQTPHNASPLDGLAREVTVTDRAHPFFGRRLVVVDERAPGARDCVLVQLPDGQRRAVPRAATSLVADGQPPSAAGARCPLPISVRTLLPLADLVRALKGGRAEVPDAATDCQPASSIAPAGATAPAAGPLERPPARRSGAGGTPARRAAPTHPRRADDKGAGR
jgi:hypothetical protein